MPFTVTITACQISSINTSIGVWDAAGAAYFFLDQGNYNYILGSGQVVINFLQVVVPCWATN
jgi:hypothetical protein